MRDFSKTVCRRMGPAVLTSGDGSQTRCRGEVARLKGRSGDYGAGQEHQTGELCEPLYVFTGDLASASPGDTLEQNGVPYTVLKAEPLTIGGGRFFLRAVMERRLDDEGA